MAVHEPQIEPVTAAWSLRVVAGPDAGLTLPLVEGRTVVGGGGCRGGLALDDPDLAAFHLLFDANGSALTLHPLADPHLRLGMLEEGDVVHAGRTVMCLARPTAPPPGAFPPSRSGPRVHHRPPRVRIPSAPSLPPSPEEPPDEPLPVAMSPWPTLLGAAITTAIAIVIGQPLLALLGLSGTAVALTTWGHARIRRIRRLRARRRADAERARRRSTDLMAHRRSTLAHHRLTTLDLCTAVERALGADPRVWERRAHHDDAWRVVLGVGDRFSDDGDVMLRDVPITVDLGPGSVIGLAGDAHALRAMVRSLVVQVAAAVGPSDVAFELVLDHSDDADAWRWLDALPHTVTTAEGDDLSEPGGLDDLGLHRIRIVDSSVPRTVHAPDVSVIVLARGDAVVPATATAHGSIDERGRMRWHADPSSDLPSPVLAALCPLARAGVVAECLGGLSDPDAVSVDPPASPSLWDLVPSDAHAIAAAWRAAGDDPPPRTLLGVDDRGRPVEIDLARDGPHGVIGGTTGSGKSELLRTLVVGLAASSPPTALSFLLVDYKGGAAFDACTELPHVVGVLTDLDGRSAERAMRSLDAELHRRERLLRDAGVADLSAYRRVRADGDIARLVIVVDEFATMAADQPDAMRALVSVAQRGRSLGVHLILATQRPAGAVTDDIRANMAIRIALRVATASEAVDLVGDAAPSAFPRQRPGRALMRLGADQPIVLQIASPCPDTAAPTDVTGDPVRPLIDTICTVAAETGGQRPHRPWLPPLPDIIGPSSLLHPLDHGLADDTAAQCRRPLRWDPSDGHLIVVGAVGSGCTSTAATTVRQVIASRDDVQVHVVDAFGDPAWDSVADLDAVGSVIRLDDAERLARVVVHLADAVQSRRSVTGDVGSVVLVVVDGVGGFRRALDDGGPDLVAMWDRVVADGPAVGVAALATSDHAASIPLAMLGRTRHRWILSLADPLDAAILGVPGSAVPPATAPPGRALCLPGALEAQVLVPGGHAPARSPRAATPRIEVLPSAVARDALPSPELADGAWSVALGLAASDLRPFWCRVGSGDHLAVLGPPGSGRTNTLTMLADAWLDVTDAQVLIVAFRADERWTSMTVRHPGRVTVCRAPADVTDRLDAMHHADGAGHRLSPLVVVDDAEHVDDLDGRIERLLSARSSIVVAALRPDRMRGALGHWTMHLRRARIALVLGASADGDVLGVVLPRRAPVPPAVGRGWCLLDGEVRDVVQIATCETDDPISRTVPVDASTLTAHTSY